MDNYVEKINNKLKILYERIYSMKDMIIVYSLIEKAQNKYQCILSIPQIINKNMQLGNYRRAVKYCILAERLMHEIESNQMLIKDRITEYMIKD